MNRNIQIDEKKLFELIGRKFVESSILAERLEMLLAENEKLRAQIQEMTEAHQKKDEKPLRSVQTIKE